MCQDVFNRLGMCSRQDNRWRKQMVASMSDRDISSLDEKIGLLSASLVAAQNRLVWHPQREHEAFEPDAFLARCRIRARQSDCAVQLSVGNGIRRAVAAVELLVCEQGKLSAEDVGVEAKCFTRSAGETDIDLQCRHAHSIPTLFWRHVTDPTCDIRNFLAHLAYI